MAHDKEQLAVVRWLETDIEGAKWHQRTFSHVGHNPGLYSIKEDLECTQSAWNGVANCYAAREATVFHGVQQNPSVADYDLSRDGNGQLFYAPHFGPLERWMVR